MEKFSAGKFSRAATLFTLPLAASFSSCGENSVNPDTPTIRSQTPETITQQMVIPEEEAKRKLLESAKKNGLGLVFVTIRGYRPDLNVEIKLERVDTLPDKRDPLLDNQTVHVDGTMREDGGPLLSVLGASSCEGEYSLSLSHDEGQTFKKVQVATDDHNIPSDVFTLGDDCFEDLFLGNPRSNVQ